MGLFSEQLIMCGPRFQYFFKVFQGFNTFASRKQTLIVSGVNCGGDAPVPVLPSDNVAD